MQEIVLRPNIGRVLVSYLFFLVIISLVSITFLLVDVIMYLLIMSIFILVFIYLIGIEVSRRYTLKEKCIEENFKFISKSTKVIPYKQITDISSNKTWIADSIFSTGSIYLSTSGSEGVNFSLSFIKNYQNIYETISQKLNLSKSIEIHENGEIVGTHQKLVESKLEDRIRPSASIATIMHALPTAAIWFYAVNIFFIVPTVIQLLFIYSTKKKEYFDFYTDKIEYYEGFLSKNKKTLSYERITDIVENRSLFDRIFGVSKIQIQTAGSSMPAITISYVTQGESIVQTLKEVLKKHGKN